MTATDLINRFTRLQKLPSSYSKTAHAIFLPLAQSIADQAKLSPNPVFIGIHGCQGSGKSTLTDFLLFMLEQHFDTDCVGMSIDDFYLTHKERLELGRDIHPLLRTRGVPGTHDIALLKNTLSSLTDFQQPVLIPRFNKAVDDRFESEFWTQVSIAPKVIFLEGWFVGATAQAADALVNPINRLEEIEDPDCTWRHFVNDALHRDYEPIFQAFDRFIMLKAPGFYAVKEWRTQQEERLRQKLSETQGDMSALMTPVQIERFIQHYQRLTENALIELPKIATDMYTLNDQREIQSVASRIGGER